MSIDGLKNLIENSCGERELQEYFKADPNILGRSLSHSAIREEYIVFSEFPIEQRLVDFVIFTDRSRMDVILLEIKGADFYFLNIDEKPNKAISNAADSIQEHLYNIGKNYLHYCKYFHEIRVEVEKGRQKFNSRIGSRGKLLVDPEKDIDLYGYVIGGKTRDDKTESKKRHIMSAAQQSIRFESWDSFLRKIA